MKVVFIVPFRNAKDNLDSLISSLIEQENDSWKCILIDDNSSDGSEQWFLNSKYFLNDKFTYCANPKRMYALYNIVENARKFEEKDDIIAVIDGDDSLCNKRTVDLLIEEYRKGYEVVWTAHKWDINDMNISREMPKNINPYYVHWSASHLRTFKSSLIKKVSDKNFKDLRGNWFKRGYDQALMLPLLKVASSHSYIDEVCYRYNINSVSMPNREWTESDQINTVNLVRARGFIK